MILLNEPETIEETEESFNEDLMEAPSLPDPDQEYDQSDIVPFSEWIETFQADSPNIQVLAAPGGNSIVIDLNNDSNIYHLKINGDSYSVLFPKDAALSVVNGYLVNESSTNISGVVVSSSDSINITNYNSTYFTILPVSSPSSNSSLYRYGSLSYLSYYSPGSANQLIHTEEYAAAEVLKTPRLGAGWSSFDYSLIGILLLTLILQLLGGFLKR